MKFTIQLTKYGIQVKRISNHNFFNDLGNQFKKKIGTRKTLYKNFPFLFVLKVQNCLMVSMIVLWLNPLMEEGLYYLVDLVLNFIIIKTKYWNYDLGPVHGVHFRWLWSIKEVIILWSHYNDLLKYIHKPNNFLQCINDFG